MNLFQTIGFTFKTSLDKETCQNLILKNISQTPRFKGKVNLDEFKISREIVGRNSFLPVIIGKITPMQNQGAVIKIKMRINHFVKVFFLFWFLAFVIGSFPISLSLLISGEYFPPLYLIGLVPFLMFFIFNYLFKKEVRLAKDILMQILEAEES